MEDFPEIIKRELTIQDMDHNDKLSVTHYQYTHWPDKGIPRDSRAVLELVRILEENETAYKDSHKPGSEKYSGPRPGPPIIHCNSGTTPVKSRNCSLGMHALNPCQGPPLLC